MTALVRSPRHAQDETTKRWFKYVRAIPRVDDDQGLELARRFRDGDRQAGEELVAAHLYVVIQVAMRLRVQTDLAFDLIQEGNAGLLDALHRFDPTRGIPFSAYSRYWARARMLAWVSSHHRIVRVGRPTRELAHRLAREREHRETLGLPCDLASLAAACDATVAEVERAELLTTYHEDGFNAPQPDGQLALAERISDDDGHTPEDEAALRELSSRLGDAVVAFADTLEVERDQVIFFERVTSDDPVSLADLGRRFGISRERARQLEARIVKSFRTFLEGWAGDLSWAA
ncbi:MAG: sigma-70 family RNA polymerase sigma factor [Alphaproteobacteria bacterium]|nr:sigma-70 family RNA polymerase sigma factor [Alphaproteobacteria bacterium]